MLLLPHDADRMLGDFLIDNGVVPRDAYNPEMADPGEGLVCFLLRKKIVSESAIARQFAHVFGFKTVELSEEEIAERPLKDKVPVSFITRNRVLPFKLEGNTLHVAIADPKGLRYVNELKLMTGYQVQTFVTELSAFDQFLIQENSRKNNQAAMSTANGLTHDEITSLLQGKEISIEDLLDQHNAAVQHEQGVNIAALQADNPKDKERKKLKAAASGSDVIDFVNQVFIDAISANVSDIHIETFRSSARVRFRRDGVLHTVEEFNDFLTLNYAAIVTRIKILASLDISERRLPQDGAITTDVAEKVVDIRVSVLPAIHGERVVMRILDPDSANFTLDELGMQEASLKALRKAVHAPQGMVLVTGPTGSGKSTTLYGVLKELNQEGINILTAEDPVEYDLEGVGQVLVRDDIGLGFAETLRSFLRQDPEVIMVGEVRDKETADIAVKAALTGHLVLSTLHTNDAPGTVTRLINMGIPDYLITSALSLVVAQRLARKICPQCSMDDTDVPVEELIALGFSEAEAKEVRCRKGKGCNACMNSGVKGRQAIHEVLVITPAIKEIVLKGASDADIRALAKKEGFHTMQDTGRQLIKDGVMTVEEYKRVLVLE